MGCLKKIIYLVLAIVVIGLIASFLLPSEINVTVNQKVDAPTEAVFAQMNDLKNWDNWSVWNQMDPNWETSYSDNTVGQGASYSWNSEHKQVGSGFMEITNSVANERVDSHMLFGDNGEQGDATGSMILTPDGDGTNVEWTFDTVVKNPIGKLMFNLMGKGAVTKSFKQGLTNLENYLKENPVAPIEAAEAAAESALIDSTVMDSTMIDQ